MEKLENSTFMGRFTLPSYGGEVQGELKLAGERSSLYMWGMNDDKVWERGKFQDADCIKGILINLKKVSLINCLTHGPSFRMVGADIVHSTSFFPHYVVFGEQHVSRYEKTITKVHFVIDDESVLFHDSNVFGVSVSPPRPLVERAVRSEQGTEEEIELGPNSYIIYHTGKKRIFKEADTVLGKVSAFHNPILNTAGNRCSAEASNRVSVTLQFPATIFEDAVSRTLKVLQFLELLVGRSQNLVKLLFYRECGQEKPEALEVYGSFFPKYERSETAERKKHFTDVLITGARSPEEFSRVLENWLIREKDEKWQHARGRFFNCFKKRTSYDIDRLTGAANAFDLLPSGAVPAEKELPEDVETAYSKSRRIFRNLSRSPERETFLDALGRAGKVRLKEKVRHRAQFIVKEIGDEIPEPEFFTVTDEAVACRHYYVHGNSGHAHVDYEKEKEIRVFLTATLEFVFAVSDLIEAGWDMKAWRKRARYSSHPFSRYINDYKDNWQRLDKCLLKKNRT